MFSVVAATPTPKTTAHSHFNAQFVRQWGEWLRTCGILFGDPGKLIFPVVELHVVNCEDLHRMSGLKA